jgi:steroid delta-isomerase-like uncharacterized protein
MSTEENKALVRGFYEAWSTQGVAAFDQFCAPSFVDHALPPGVPPTLAGAKMAVAVLATAFPDLRTTAEELVAEGDTVVGRMYCSGTHLGDFQGVPPTGKHVKIASFDMFRIADGKLVEHWSVSDSLSMLQQLGLIPQTNQAGGQFLRIGHARCRSQDAHFCGLPV